MADTGGWVAPMAATLTRERFPGDGWVFERKLDGVRALAIRRAGHTRLLSRNRRDISAGYPEVVDALDSATRVDDFVLDGEIVAFDGDRTSFAMLQQRIHQTKPSRISLAGVPVFFYLFDMLGWDGRDARRLALSDRKGLLVDALTFADPLRFTEHRSGAGKQMYVEACRRGWEGVIAKRAASRYVSGRSRDWLKFKCLREQEFVVGGYTLPTGARHGVGALLIGHYTADGLAYAGKVGTGFTETVLAELRRTLDQVDRSTSPFLDIPKEKTARWVEPRLVVQVGFAEWTTAGRLRHPTYKGQRLDKDPREVVREDL